MITDPYIAGADLMDRQRDARGNGEVAVIVPAGRYADPHAAAAAVHTITGAGTGVLSLRAEISVHGIEIIDDDPSARPEHARGAIVSVVGNRHSLDDSPYLRSDLISRVLEEMGLEYEYDLDPGRIILIES